MKKNDLISLTELEKLNETELINVKGGINNATAMTDALEDSQHHDSDNSDKFKEKRSKHKKADHKFVNTAEY